MPAPLDAFYRRFARFHRWLYLTSGGWLGHHLTGIPSLVLVTVGRRSGQRRAVTLTYVRDGRSPVVVASNYGGGRPPAWLLNLVREPEAEVWLGHRRLQVRASVVEPGDPDHQRLWRLANRGPRGRYDRYQQGTTRPIPVVRLRPVG